MTEKLIRLHTGDVLVGQAAEDYEKALRDAEMKTILHLPEGMSHYSMAEINDLFDWVNDCG